MALLGRDVSWDLKLVFFYSRVNIQQRLPFTCDNPPVGSASLEEYLRAYTSARGGVFGRV